jgi:hypothetical protein
MGEMKEIYTALVKAQGMIKNAVKDSTNPHYKSKYADLESVWDAIREALQKNNLAVLQLTDIDASGAPVLVTRVIHISGEHIEGRYPLVCKDPTDAQKLGSSTSYARRYSLSAMLGVIQSDDDGNAAAGHTPAPAPKPAAKVQQSISDLFAVNGLKYPAALEDQLGKQIPDWTAADKSAARQAVEALKAGKAWDECKSILAKAAVFS